MLKLKCSPNVTKYTEKKEQVGFKKIIDSFRTYRILSFLYI